MLKRVAAKGRLFIMVSFCVATVAHIVPVGALQSSSYRFDETTIGAGGLADSSSDNFSGSSSTGDLAVGNTASGNFQIETGSQTTPDPTLSFQIDSGDINFGNFTASGPTVTTATFSVSNYTSYGYVVQVTGNPPSNGPHSIAPMAETDVSQPGIDQFGINLVANTLPLSVGANPDNGDFGFGEIAPSYATPNQYRYVNGETIALAPKSSGVTKYTISYLVNVDSLTPGGQYTSNQTLIVTGTY